MHEIMGRKKNAMNGRLGYRLQSWIVEWKKENIIVGDILLYVKRHMRKLYIAN